MSGWKDEDKEGRRYRDYFEGASEYWVTNYESAARGFQGNLENEIFLDLTSPIPDALIGRFDVVFNHTVLEHIFDCRVAFRNLCCLSSDVVIVVVPFLQEQHADYGDYWRFTPQAIDKLFIENDLETVYLSANDGANASIYVFAIGAKDVGKWREIISAKGNLRDGIYNQSLYLGRSIFRASLVSRLIQRLARW